MITNSETRIKISANRWPATETCSRLQIAAGHENETKVSAEYRQHVLCVQYKELNQIAISPFGTPQTNPQETTLETQQTIDQAPAPRKRRSQAEIIAHQTSIYDDIQQRRRTNALPNPPKSREPTSSSKPTASALPGLPATAKSHPDLPQPNGQEAPNVVPPENDDPGKDLAPDDEDESFTSKIISTTESITISDNSEPSAAPCSTPPPSPNPRPSPARTCIKRAFNVGTYLRLLLLPLAACTRSNRPRNEGHLPGHDV